MSALEDVLSPLSRYYAQQDVIELRMSRPGSVVIDRRGIGKQVIHDDRLTLSLIGNICRALANNEGIAFNANSKPKLSCIIPGGRHRFECAIGPSVQTGLSLAIRCKHGFTPTWDDLGVDEDLHGYFYQTVAGSQNIIISGATNTGKTTLLNLLLDMVPDSRRVVAMEDTPEISLDRFYDGIGLIAGRDDGAHAAMLNWRQLYDHVMRITPDHIIFGEISTQNAYPALGALNSGVTGFMCTIHAYSPWQALNRKFDHNIAWSGQVMPRVPEFLADLIDVVIQIARDEDGLRRISHIYEPRGNRYLVGSPPEARQGAGTSALLEAAE